MVVEIRSDGSRTIARGAIEDHLGGQAVGVEARADSPLELSRALAKMVLSAPFAALLGRAKGDVPPRDKGVLAILDAYSQDAFVRRDVIRVSRMSPRTYDAAFKRLLRIAGPIAVEVREALSQAN